MDCVSLLPDHPGTCELQDKILQETMEIHISEVYSLLCSPCCCLRMLQLWQWIAESQNVPFQKWTNTYWKVPKMREESPNVPQSLFCPCICHVCELEGSQAQIYVISPQNVKTATTQPSKTGHETTWREKCAATGPRVQYNFSHNTNTWMSI